MQAIDRDQPVNRDRLLVCHTM